MNYRKLLEKYMRDVVVCEGNAFVCDEWDEWLGPDGYTKAEHAALVELRDKIYAEQK